jgi:hypothetical protein
MATPKPIEWLTTGYEWTFSLGAVEFWLNRYQGLIGSVVAFIALCFLFVQTKTQIRTLAMIEENEKERRARALSLVLDVIEPMNQVAGEIIAFMNVAHYPDESTSNKLWRICYGDPHTRVSPDLISSDYDRSQILEAAVVSLPSQLADVRHLLDSATEYKEAWRLYLLSGTNADGGSLDPVAEYHGDPDYRRLVDAITRMNGSAFVVKSLEVA